MSRPRRTFCSDRCVNEFSIHNDPGYARHRVALRDHGICALCSLDCGELDDVLRRDRVRGIALLAERGLTLTPSERSRSTWAADHIVPVVHGGGACGLENLRTLCIWCHKKETARVLHGRAA